METETCTNCLHHIVPDEFHDGGVWIHLTTDRPECDPDDSPGTFAEPRR